MKIRQCLPFDARFVDLDLTDLQREIYVVYGESGSNVNEAARRTGKDVSQVSTTIRAIQRKALKFYGQLDWDATISEIVEKPLKVLFFDIETSPHLVRTFTFRPQWIGENQVVEYSKVISFAAKWIGEDEIIYHESRGKSDKAITKKMMALLDRCDVCVAHNGRAFDVKTIKGRALKHNLNPPSPFKVADTLQIARREFKLPRNSLSFLAEFLNCTPKQSHSNFSGMLLWMECAKGNEEAWKEMKSYNVQDVLTLEEVYYRLRSWDSQSPNLGIFKEDTVKVCPKCGASGTMRKQSPVMTQTQAYDSFICTSCRGWSRGRNTILDKEARSKILTNAKIG